MVGDGLVGRVSGYLRVSNWERYQNADVFKKSHGRPPWVKLFVRRDLELDQCCIEARILFYELLKVAGDYANVMSNDLNWISSETRLPLKVVVKGLPVLRKGAWLSETSSPRRSRKIREPLATRSREEVEKKVPKAVISSDVERPSLNDLQPRLREVS